MSSGLFIYTWLYTQQEGQRCSEWSTDTVISHAQKLDLAQQSGTETEYEKGTRRLERDVASLLDKARWEPLPCRVQFRLLLLQ